MMRKGPSPFFQGVNLMGNSFYYQHRALGLLHDVLADAA